MTQYSITVKAADPERRALILPGQRYPSSAPLLWYTGKVLMTRRS